MYVINSWQWPKKSSPNYLTKHICWKHPFQSLVASFSHSIPIQIPNSCSMLHTGTGNLWKIITFLEGLEKQLEHCRSKNIWKTSLEAPLQSLALSFSHTIPVQYKFLRLASHKFPVGTTFRKPSLFRKVKKTFGHHRSTSIWKKHLLWTHRFNGLDLKPFSLFLFCLSIFVNTLSIV